MLYLALLTCIFSVIVPVAAAEGLQFYYQQNMALNSVFEL